MNITYQGRKISLLLTLKYLLRGLLVGRGIIQASRIYDLVGKQEIEVGEGLVRLRSAASSLRPSGKLLEWGRHHLNIPQDIEVEWFQRAWWGLWASEIFRNAVQSPNLHDHAMEIVDGPPQEVTERISRRDKGLIFSCAHLGPTQACVAWLLHQKQPLLVWIATNGFDKFPELCSQATFLNASGGKENLTAAYLHLRRGGLFFAAVDGGSNNKFLEVDRFKVKWRCATAMPVLARSLSIPAECIRAQWKGNRIVIDSERLELPEQGLDENSWNERWMESFWRSVDENYIDSPENLSVPLYWPDDSVQRDIGLAL